MQIISLCLCSTICFFSTEGNLWKFATQFQYLNSKIWLSYIDSTIKHIISETNIFFSNTTGDSTNSLIHFTTRFYLKNMECVETHRQKMLLCTQETNIHDTCGRVCGHMPKNTFPLVSYVDSNGAQATILGSAYTILLLQQKWRFKLFISLGLNISVLQINLIQNCPFEALLVSNSQVNKDINTFCGRRPQEEIFCPFHSIDVILYTDQWTEHHQHEVVFQYQVYDRHFVRNTIQNNFDTLRPALFLHKTFTLSTSYELSFFHVKVSKLNLVLVFISNQLLDMFLLQGVVISTDYNVVKACGINHTIITDSFQCLLVVQHPVQKNSFSTEVNFTSVEQSNASNMYLPTSNSHLTLADVHENGTVKPLFFIWTQAQKFLKITIDILIYDGPTSSGCLYGGFSLFHIENEMSENYVECVTLCKYNSSLNYLSVKQASFILASSTGYIVLYSYKGISSLKVKVIVSVSKCQGIFLDPCQKPEENSFYSAKVKVWLAHSAIQIVQIHMKHCSVLQIRSNLNWGNKHELAFCSYYLSVTSKIVSERFHLDFSANFAEDISLFHHHVGSLGSEEICPHSSFDSFVNNWHLSNQLKHTIGDELTIDTSYGDSIDSCKLLETNEDAMKHFHFCLAFKIEGAQKFGNTWFLENGSHGGARITVGHINGSVYFQASVTKYNTIPFARVTDMIFVQLKRSSDSHVAVKVYRTKCENKFICLQYKHLHFANSISMKCQPNTTSLMEDKSIQLLHSSDDHFLTLKLISASMLDLTKQCTFCLTYSSKLPKEICCDKCCGVLTLYPLLKLANTSFGLGLAHTCWDKGKYCLLYNEPVINVTTKLSSKSLFISPEMSLFPSFKRFIEHWPALSKQEQFVFDIENSSERSYCSSLMDSLVFKWQPYKSKDTKLLSNPSFILILPHTQILSWENTNTECIKMGKILPQITCIEDATSLVDFVMKGTVDTFYPLGVFISSRRCPCRSLKVSHSALPD